MEKKKSTYSPLDFFPAASNYSGLRSALLSIALLPMIGMAQTVSSPNGNVTVKFSLTDDGQPTYEMEYKG